MTSSPITLHITTLISHEYYTTVVTTHDVSHVSRWVRLSHLTSAQCWGAGHQKQHLPRHAGTGRMWTFTADLCESKSFGLAEANHRLVKRASRPQDPLSKNVPYNHPKSIVSKPNTVIVGWYPMVETCGNQLRTATCHGGPCLASASAPLHSTCQGPQRSADPPMRCLSAPLTFINYE